jgi:hypothetical protein
VVAGGKITFDGKIAETWWENSASHSNIGGGDHLISSGIILSRFIANCMVKLLGIPIGPL